MSINILIYLTIQPKTKDIQFTTKEDKENQRTVRIEKSVKVFFCLPKILTITDTSINAGLQLII